MGSKSYQCARRTARCRPGSRRDVREDGRGQPQSVLAGKALLPDRYDLKKTLQTAFSHMAAAHVVVAVKIFVEYLDHLQHGIVIVPGAAEA